MNLFVKTLGFIAGVALSGAVCAVGMGGINVTTDMGEPLKAEIDLVAVSKAERSSMVARLASPDLFKGAGLDYPSALPRLRFQIDTRANGQSYIRVSSDLPVSEPFVNLLVELSWSSGRLLREYTFLLDPPGFKSEQPAASEVKPVTPLAAAKSAEATTARAPAPVNENVIAMPETPAGKSAGRAQVASGTIRVRRGDTLNSIARNQVESTDISLERMLVALYRANTGAFDDDNMNRLKIGKILRVPGDADLEKLTQDDALREVRAQAADWHAYRQKLAAASGAAPEQSPRQEASGKISTTITDKAPAAPETAREVVKLSKGEAPGDKIAADASTKALRDKVHALEEEAIARNKALKDSNDRIAMLEKSIKEMQRLIELKGLPVAPGKPETKPEPAQPAPPAEMPVQEAAPAVAAESGAAASAVKPAKPAVKQAAPKEVPPPPSLLDEILGEPLYLAGGAIALLGLGGLAYMRTRRGKDAGKAVHAADRFAGEGEGEESSHISAPVAPSPETGDFTQKTAAAPSAAAGGEEVDPISEADLFLSFGRDAQAEEILKDALAQDPANQRIRLKLLSIYANRNDVRTFAAVAHQVHESGDAEAWASAAEMGRKLDPNNTMYGAVAGAGAVIAVEAATAAEHEPAAAAGLDFDLGVGEKEAGTVSAVQAVDFDLGSAETTSEIQLIGTEGESTMMLPAPSGDETMVLPSESQSVAQETADEATPEPTKAPELDDLAFDLPSDMYAMAPVSAETPVAETPAGTEETLAFTLDFPAADEPVAASPAPAEEKAPEDIGLDEISLDLDVPASAAPAAEVKDAHWHDVATKLDLARAYHEMGDAAGAREILEEVMREGDQQQCAAAEAMMQQLPA